MIAALTLSLLAAQAAPPTTTASPAPSPKPTPAGPVVVLETSLGIIEIGLYKDKSPVTVDNFLQYVRAKHFDGTVFHRVIPDFMIQGGGFDPGMTEKPTRPPIKNEAANGLRNSRGTVAMARTQDPNSATAQFFISLKDNHSLDYGIGGAGYAVFGEVLKGMEVVDKIAQVPTGNNGPYQNVPLTPVLIKSAREAGAKPAAAAKPAAPAPAKAAPRPPAKPPAKPKG
jgi:peptidyl-prolyl cis-trans isomerase A (cyclophilin A)